MSVWFSKRSKAGSTSRFSASIPFTLVFVLIAVLVVTLLSALSWLIGLFR